MSNLVDKEGKIKFGLFNNPITNVNYWDYDYQTPMGIKVWQFIKKIIVNQFHFVGIAGPEFIIGLAVVDLKYLSNGFFYIYNRKTNKLIEKKKISPLNFAVNINTNPESCQSEFKSKNLKIFLKHDNVFAYDKDAFIDVKLNNNKTNPFRLCARNGYTGWVFTQKTAAIEVKGKIKIGKKEYSIASPDYMAISDWTTGFMRHETFWNWAAFTTTLPDGRKLGVNLSCGVNETSFTENFIVIDGKHIKIDSVNFNFDNTDLNKKWHIKSFDKKIDLIFNPESNRKEKVNLIAIASNFTQLFGVFNGKVKLIDNKEIKINNCPGWVEDHYAKW